MMKGIFKFEKEGGKTPYLESRGAFSEMYASYVNGEQRWRYAAYGAISLAAISLGGLIAVSLQHKVAIYAVEFNEHAEAVRITRAGEIAQPSSNQVRAALRDLVIQLRTVYVDRRAQDSLMKAATAKVLPNSAAYQVFANYVQEHNPYIISERSTVEVSVNSVRAISDKTWLVEWTETKKELSGRVIDSRIWHGSFSVVVVPPSEESQIYANPIGMYVTEFSWGERQ
jgi:type IV secretion system protein TrbF